MSLSQESQKWFNNIWSSFSAKANIKQQKSSPPLGPPLASSRLHPILLFISLGLATLFWAVLMFLGTWKSQVGGKCFFVPMISQQIVKMGPFNNTCLRLLCNFIRSIQPKFRYVNTQWKGIKISLMLAAMGRTLLPRPKSDELKKETTSAQQC